MTNLNTDLNTGPITMLICALGGEGGGVLTEWLVDAARAAGYPAQSTSIPGVAQRTGATTYYVEILPVALSQLGGQQPVFSLSPVPGELDLLISSELLETARQIGNGMSTPGRTMVITSSARTLTTAERMQMGDGRADSAVLLDVVRQFSREHQVLDMTEMARTSGTVVSAVMLGAIAGSGLLPFKREVYEAVIRAGGKGSQASLAGFAAACEAVRQPRAQADMVRAVLADDSDEADGRAGHAITPATLPDDTRRQFPPTVHDVLALGHARLVDYQDAGYAGLYAQRLARVLEAERQADPAAAQGHATTREVARWLALWMAYDDIVRVADLKSRASRWQRVRREVKAEDGDLLNLYDHFKPGVPEFAALLPPALASRLMAWDRRRVAAGREPWAMPLKVGTHSVGGLLALRLLASLRWLRPRGQRHANEQAMIEQWLAGVIDGTRRHAALGFEVAQCGRLIKGYGSTNERGKDNLLHVLEHLARLPDAQSAAAAVAYARQAALADDAGHALDATLARHGAPARPVKPQPIRWMRRPTTPAT